eukprot:jgi/Tetstr1/447121/TSEL_034559.t1
MDVLQDFYTYRPPPPPVPPSPSQSVLATHKQLRGRKKHRKILPCSPPPPSPPSPRPPPGPTVSSMTGLTKMLIRVCNSYITKTRSGNRFIHDKFSFH